MKNIFTLLLIFIGTISYSQDNKPTKEETIEWLNSKITYVKFNDKNMQLTKEIGVLSSGTKWKIIEHFVEYSQIKSVSYNTAKEKTDNHKITLFGTFVQIHKDRPADDANVSEIKHSEIPLNSSVPEAEIQKIVKALKHLATLEGAKFLNENLFD